MGMFSDILHAGNLSDDNLARNIATLPSRFGGLGLRNAARSSEGAYLASWIDRASMIAKKVPELSKIFLEKVGAAIIIDTCLL